MLNPTRDENEGKHRGGENEGGRTKDTRDHGLSRGYLRVKPLTSELEGKIDDLI